MLKITACCLFFTMISLGLLYFEIIPSHPFFHHLATLHITFRSFYSMFLCIQYFRKQNTIMENAVSQITEYISGISHQLKTPLAALNIYNGILQGETEDLPELQEFVSLSEKELERMETLVQNLLKITKLGKGTLFVISFLKVPTKL